MSKLMVELQLATAEGGDYLQQFADVAGVQKNLPRHSKTILLPLSQHLWKALVRLMSLVDRPLKPLTLWESLKSVCVTLCYVLLTDPISYQVQYKRPTPLGKKTQPCK